MPQNSMKLCVDSEGKFLDFEVLKKVWIDSQKSEASSDDMLVILKEENANLKSKIMELSK